MAVQIQLRRGTASAWTVANPTLAIGEFAVETDTDRYKIGDGSTAWTSLSYSSLPAGALTTAGGVTITGTITHGADGTGADVRWNSGTAGDYMLWDASEEQLVITGTSGATALNIADGNVVIAGDLTVNGTSINLSTTNTVVEDALIELNNGASSNANDLGIVMERGSTGDNAIIAWDESADKFTMGTTTATGASSGNLTITAGTLVANVEGAVTGNADTATALATARTINGVSFDGTANITATAAAGTLSGATLNSGVTASSLTSVGTITGLTVDGTSQLYEAKTEEITGNKTPALTDAGKVFWCSQTGSTQTITIDGSISWPVGTQMVFVAEGTATVTFAGSNSANLYSKDSNLSIDGRYASAALINYATNKWSLIGALA